MNVIFSVVFIFGLFGNFIDAEINKESVQIINHPHKNEYAAVVAGSDKHKYGYELKENRHFHHTTTEEDGVRLGCYGYVLFGKKYSTQYVADVKGYRPVFTHDLITVYPKSGGERKASFVGDFNEDKQRSENIRYFFPDGCKGSDLVIAPNTEVPMNIPIRTFIKTEGPISPPTLPVLPQVVITPPIVPIVPNVPTPPPTPRTPSPTPRTPPPTPRTPPPTPRTTPPTPRTTPPTPPPSTPRPSPPVTTPFPKAPAAITTPKLPSQQLISKIPAPPSSSKTDPPKDTCERSCCSDDDSAAKLVLPVPLKNVGKSGSCEKFAKLIIPVDGLNPDSLRSLTRGADTSELIRTVLQSLA